MAGSIPDAREEVPRDELVGDVADVLHAVMRRIRHGARTDLEPLGVTPGQVRALRLVDAGAGTLRMADLADRLHIARRSATSVVDELETRGLVERRDDPDDRRGVLVATTPAGRRVLDELRGRRRSAAADVFAELSDRDLATLQRLLAPLARDR